MSQSRFATPENRISLANETDGDDGMTATRKPTLTSWRFVSRVTSHHWRMNLAIALGVAAATAVLTGALLVGDSVRGSLQALTLDRLGKVDEVLLADRYFDIGLADALTNQKSFQDFFVSATPAILFPHGTVERHGTETSRRASSVMVVGCTPSFWTLGEEQIRPAALPGERQIVLNQPLADDLQIAIGDKVVLRLPSGDPVPADSPLASKRNRVRSLAGLEVVDILPARSLGQFRLRASQTSPRNAFVSLKTLQLTIGEPEKGNAILVQGRDGLQDDQDRSWEASRCLARLLHPSFEDYGFVLRHVQQRFSRPNEPPREIFNYFSLTTDRMILSPEAEKVALRAYAKDHAQSVFTYLANRIEVLSEGSGDEVDTSRPLIPYSTVTAIDMTDHFALRDLEGSVIAPLDDEEIVLNEWAANRLNVHPGDSLQIQFFQPETTHGEPVEQTARFTLKAITPLTTPARPFRRKRPAEYDEAPELGNDPDLTPEVEGVTDQATINDWDPPFPFDPSLVTDEDEAYWDNHRTTPKAFISLAAGRALWGSRFGAATSIRIPAGDGRTEASLKEKLIQQITNEGIPLGFEFQPVKRRQLEASRGTTPFDGLFLALSFFVIAAALLLVSLLFRLGVQQRAREVGTLLAVGLRRRKVARLMLQEGAIVSACGGLIGVAIGVAYALLMLAGLRTWWVGAVTTPFLQFHYTPTSLALGYFLGLLTSLSTIGLSLLGLRRVPVSRLLAGRTSSAEAVVYRIPRIPIVIATLLLFIALALLIVAITLTGMEQAGAFVSGGAALLTGALLLIWGLLKMGGAVRSSTRMNLGRLAIRNAARNPSRSAATIGLMSVACFLVVAMSSFRMDPSVHGAGGFDLVGKSSAPFYEDLNNPRVRSDWLGNQARRIQSSKIFGLRLREGDDASCNNLYRPSQPRVIGVTQSFVDHFDASDAPSFSWATSEAKTPKEQNNPWRLLMQPRDASHDAIPVVIDLNTASYSLKPKVGLGDIYQADYGGGPLRFRVVGLLANSLLQGSLIVGESDFQACFPDVEGYRYFLIQSPEELSKQTTEVLEDRLSDQGLDVVTTFSVLRQLLAVQNTYLSTFQSLGALGLLLGTFGLATVQLRNVLERRGELALLRAAGFGRRRLGHLVLFENLFLLLCGLLTGVLVALLAVLPHQLLGNASISASSLLDLTFMLAIVLGVGVVASIATTQATLRTPILEALREEP